MRRLATTWWLAVVVAAVAGVGCSKCGQSATAPGASKAQGVERLLPKSAIGVVVVPNVKTLGERLRVLESLKVAAFVGQTQGFDSPKAFSDALMSQLGVDLRSDEALRAAGLDGSRGLGVMLLLSGEVALVLPVKDAGAFHTTLERISHQRLGAGAGGEFKGGDGDAITVKTFAAQQGQPPKVGYVLHQGFAFIATNNGVKSLPTLAALTEENSLASEAALSESLARLPKDAQAYLYVPRGSPALNKYPVTSALATAALSASGLALAVDAPWRGDAAALAMLEAKPGPSLTGFLPKDAFLTLRYSGAPPALAPVVNQLLGGFVSRAFGEASFDVKTQVLDVVKPGAVLSLSLADRPPMDRGLPQQFDVRTTNPFTYAHLSGVAEVTTPESVMPTLERIAEVSPKFGAKMSKVNRDERPIMFTTYSAGEGVHFAPKGPYVFFGSPVQRLDELVKVDPAAATAAPAPAGLGPEALSLVVDLSALAASVRALPESAWGIGGFAIKATTVRWLDATDDLKAVTASLGVKDQALQARVNLVLAPAGGTGAPKAGTEAAKTP